MIDKVTKIHKNTPDIVAPEIHHQMLYELAHNPDLEHFQIVCHAKGGTVTTGWSHGIRSSVMALGHMILGNSIMVAIYNPGVDEMETTED